MTLCSNRPIKGGAWLRTNIGHAGMIRDDIISEVHRDRSPLGRGWFDVEMKPTGQGRYQVTLPLCEVGHFEAKAFFLEEGSDSPVWPDGENIAINVAPAGSCRANIIYNAFVRQFGPNRQERVKTPISETHLRHLDEAGYTVIPPSGTFRDLIARLDFIFDTLGCNILQLLPIHPTPTTYARMGRFGSPYAALGFTGVDPALAVFDPASTPMEQFAELVDAVHARRGWIFLDIAINHTGWAARLHEDHPEWLLRDTQGRIQVPGAWGVEWADLTRLDYSHKALWRFMAGVFLTWCSRGVDGFRCDAGYMIPQPAWRYIIARVRDQFPDTIFLLEGLGGPISTTRGLLNIANLNWAYSELFQNYDRREIEAYLPEAIQVASTDGLMVHYAETHDNRRLAAISRTYAKMRTAICALFSSNGAFGFANGVEWYASEKIDVHDAPSLNWGSPENQIEHIRRLGMILKNHPAFSHGVELRFIHNGPGNYLALLRQHPGLEKRLLVLANLDHEHGAIGSWDAHRFAGNGDTLLDLLTGRSMAAQVSDGEGLLRLDPGEVLCLTENAEDLIMVQQEYDYPLQRSTRQYLRGKALDVHRYYHGTRELGDFQPDRQADALFNSPTAFCRRMNILGQDSRTIRWQWPRDAKREVMIPPGYFLLVMADTPFRARLEFQGRTLAQEESLPQRSGAFFGLFSPLKTPKVPRRCRLKIWVYNSDGCKHGTGHLLRLPRPQSPVAKRIFFRADFKNAPRLLLGTNRRGGMLRAPVFWGELNSRYDALLAANLNPTHPVDRWIMFSRCRAWVVYQGYSQELTRGCLVSFEANPTGGGCWRFRVPTGQGEHIILSAVMDMVPHRNAMAILFYRHGASGRQGRLGDSRPVVLILRPDVEDRSFHAATKAYTGPQHVWEAAVTRRKQGFSFQPHPARELRIRVNTGNYIHEPKWHYMVHRSLEAERGLDPDSDLFSPGYFASDLPGNASEILTAGIQDTQALPDGFEDRLRRLAAGPVSGDVKSPSFFRAMTHAMDQFIVTREPYKSVIAGYPWFLDWGRDSLMVTRGLIAAGKIEEARAVLHQFGRFEKNGTLPNMIHGDRAGNRDTSDAPLWFFVAWAELVRVAGGRELLEQPCGDRTIREILICMAKALASALPNGVRMDPESGLIFSPTHFTWMDTNHPAGSPREGYPIEIQALWYAALSFTAQIDPQESSHRWTALANRVQDSILRYYYLKDDQFLSDCLHAGPHVSAEQAQPDDALRPNQLLAVTLGAVTDREIRQKIVNACQELIIPGAIRSLADRQVRRPITVIYKGQTINNPIYPYQGKYAGDEDTRRKPAYHNGTAWTWLFPSFCEAWARAYGVQSKETALAWLYSAVRLVNSRCVGHVTEVLDGDFPHIQRGCDAQAWGISELLRVWLILTGKNKKRAWP